MQKKQDISYGVVPLYQKQEGEYQILVIHQRSWTGEQFWIFPKGHPEGDESPTVAAARELQEETGIVDVLITPQPTFSMQYTFTHEGSVIKKTVTYFIGTVRTPDTVITQPDEVVALRWCSFAEAFALLSHENSKGILRQVQAHLTTKEAAPM